MQTKNLRDCRGGSLYLPDGFSPPTSSGRTKGGLFAVLFCLMFTPAFAGTGLAFLEIPVGARESALGGAGAALISGPTSVAYNPATTALRREITVALMHNRHFGDTRSEFFAASLLPGRFVVTPHYIGTRTSDIEYRTEPTRDPISTFDATNSAVGATVATRFGEKLSAGATARYVYQKIRSDATDGATFDAGVYGVTPVEGLTAGVALNHMGRLSNFAEERPSLPTTLRAGAAYTRDLGKAGSGLITLDGLGISEQSPQIRAGLEWNAPRFLSLRAGFVEGLDTQSASFGFGLALKQVRLDYAFIPFSEGLDDGHRFSLAFDL